MIPLHLTLKNFLSYREASLDFRGLHIACICGANGAGKSSLLEAIAWSVWGQSRATEDDVIHQGEEEARVIFVFRAQQQTYRIIRSRYRSQPSVLEFQMQVADGFRSLTERSVRATQHRILQHLRLDYETFVNSAYLRQGRADEFMLKRPSERKQILADLLKLDQYELLAEQAKEQVRELKAELSTIDRSLIRLGEALAQEAILVAEQAQIEQAIAQMQQQHQADSHALQELWAVQQQRQTWQQQRTMLQQQQQHLMQDAQRLQQELAAAQHQQQTLMAILAEERSIAQGYAYFQHLQAQEETQTARSRLHQTAQAQRQQLQQQQSDRLRDLQAQKQQAQIQLENLAEQNAEIQHILSKSNDIANAIEHLKQARSQLVRFDQLQLQASPLMQRRQQIHTELDRAQTRLSTRIEELQSIANQLQQQQSRQPQIQQAVREVAGQVEYLEQRKNYQQRVREKGVERRNFLDRLQDQQREYERQLAELDHKIRMLQREEDNSNQAAIDTSETAIGEEITSKGLAVKEATNGRYKTSEMNSKTEYPPCPLCDRPLDEHHWQVVLDRHRAEQQEIQRQIWVIREQLSLSDREIELLRKEYAALEQELGSYSIALERKGQLQEQLQGTATVQERLTQIQLEQAEIQRSIQSKTFASSLHEELALLDRSLTQLGYDDKDHALARGEVDRWRWAEIKQAELRQAQKRQAQLQQQQPQIEAQIAEIERQIRDLARSLLQQQINQLDAEIARIDYDFDRHTALRQVLKQAQNWQLRYQELGQAQQQYPQVQQQVQELHHLLETRSNSYKSVHAQITALDQQLTQTPDRAGEIQDIEKAMQERRARLDRQLAQQGRLEQQLQQIADFKIQHSELSQQLQTSKRQQRIYQELAQAFGKNGIQALMIENLLPQLEIEANQILGRLSAHQLHIQFVTQKSRKGKSAPTAKLIDTLDILIADLHGTRPYETYSGGEAFRVNFAIRLALARLLAQRSGTALQLLIIDEGFGTQDEAGCDRLIGAIQAIAPDFACILTVTHMPHFKEAFQTRIEISKTSEGSRINLSA
ncbi:SMC family ATPase [Microcoleus sp. FACHB-1515]|uniref:AAA family ATPase n=1 Tax=Cyanophyceae TaxID=3028117 RepID=UPI0016821EB9|nr:SMC family ATPase [Microcoleus sp. FACHB-1515]MBD2090588.1 SMC family ATPase [Microcoleus sp. FACHB-1515]